MLFLGVQTLLPVDAVARQWLTAYRGVSFLGESRFCHNDQALVNIAHVSGLQPVVLRSEKEENGASLTCLFIP